MIIDERRDAPLLPRSDVTEGRFEIGQDDCVASDPERGESAERMMTVDDALGHIGIGQFQWCMLCVLGFSYMADAGEMLFLSFLGPAVKCEWNLTGTEESMITTVVFAGMAIGSFSFGTLADFFGRKPATIADVAFTAVAGLLSATAVNFWTLVLCRFLVGCGVGGFVLVLSMYSEFLPMNHRGKSLSIYQVFWGIGACLEVLIAWVVMPRFHWRGLAVASAIPLVLLVLVLPFIPESPRFLVVTGETEKALDVLHVIARVNGKPLPRNVQLKPPTLEKTSTSSNWKRFINQFAHLFEDRLGSITRIIWPTWIATALAYYSIVILTTAIQAADDEDDCDRGHITFSNEEYRNILIDASGEIPGVLLATFTIDVFGRKKTLMFGWYGCALAMLLLPIASSAQIWLMFAGRLFIMFLFTVVLVMVPELYPSYCRSFAMGAGNLMSRIGGALSPFLAQAMYDAYGLTVVAVFHGVLFVLAGTSAILIPFETSGRPMPDTIDDLQDREKTPINACNGVLSNHGACNGVLSNHGLQDKEKLLKDSCNGVSTNGYTNDFFP